MAAIPPNTPGDSYIPPNGLEERVPSQQQSRIIEAASVGLQAGLVSEMGAEPFLSSRLIDSAQIGVKRTLNRTERLLLMLLEQSRVAEIRSLPLSQIANDVVAFAVKYACIHGYHESIEILLTEERTLTPNQLDACVENAAIRGYLNIVIFLLRGNRTLTPSQLNSCVANTVYQGHLDILTFFLSEGRSLNQGQLDNAVFIAATSGHLNIVDFLLRQGPISQSIRDSSITNTAAGEDRERIRDLLRQARVVSYQRVPAQEEVCINFNEVKSSTRDYLRIIFERGLPKRICVLNDDGSISPAYDLGGITKQFITSLSEALSTSYLKLNDQRLPAMQSGQEEMYVHLGRLVSLVWESNLSRTDKVLTGFLFSEHFLRLVKVVLEAGEGGFTAVCAVMKDLEPSFKTTIDLILEPTIEHRNAYLILMGREEEVQVLREGDPATEARGPDMEEADAVLEEARSHILPFYEAARCFALGLTEQFRAHLLSVVDLHALSCSFQGELISVKAILAALSLVGENFSPQSRAILDAFASGDEATIEALRLSLRQGIDTPSSSRFVDKVDWLVQILVLKDSSQEEDRRWLEKFVFAVTGKKAMLPGMTFRLQSSWREGLTFELHTCFNGLDLPKIEVSREDFIAALSLAIDQDDYNIA